MKLMRTLLAGEGEGVCSGVGEGGTDCSGEIDGEGDSPGVGEGVGVGDSCARRLRQKRRKKDQSENLKRRSGDPLMLSIDSASSRSEKCCLAIRSRAEILHRDYL